MRSCFVYNGDSEREKTLKVTSFMDRVFYADLNGHGNRFRLKPAAAVI